MSILRVKRTKGYTTIPNSTLCDHRLSFRARGVLAFLLAKPDDWETRTTDLPEHGREGRDAVRAALKELRDLGYMSQEREQFRDEDTGKWLWRTVTVVRDFPEPENPSPEDVPRTDSQASESSCHIPTQEEASEDGFSGAPLLPSYITTNSQVVIEKTTSSPPRRSARSDPDQAEETPRRPGGKGWDAVRPVYRPKKKSRREQAEEAALAEKELDPAYVVAQVLGSDAPGDVQNASLEASDDDLVPPVRRGRKPRSLRPSEVLASYFDKRAQEVGHPVPGATNLGALSANFGRWMNAGTDKDEIRKMIITYWSSSWQRSENVVAWKDFLAQRGLLTGRQAKADKATEMEKHRYDTDYWS
ncbi:hypothetical protein PV336_15945 [Streptomyces sp. MI02-2A]|uniref:hypothetical protein n=1 Tax=Streptomyces sp. MI02-2A TaxID=3028688 RepID=UPI0029A2CE0C|nr:hypothetical protein [Streptomyces sp. MI02-2A]MDX3260712.1 hypothetical protein [Streptomyces sp. MI02-2A]